MDAKNLLIAHKDHKGFMQRMRGRYLLFNYKAFYYLCITLKKL